MKEEIEEIMRLVAEGGYHQRSIKEMQEEYTDQILNLFKEREARRMQEIIDFIETSDKTATDIKSFINGTYLEEQNK